MTSPTQHGPVQEDPPILQGAPHVYQTGNPEFLRSYFTSLQEAYDGQATSDFDKLVTATTATALSGSARAEARELENEIDEQLRDRERLRGQADAAEQKASSLEQQADNLDKRADWFDEQATENERLAEKPSAGLGGQSPSSGASFSGGSSQPSGGGGDAESYVPMSSAPIKEGGPTIGGTPDSNLGSTAGGESISGGSSQPSGGGGDAESYVPMSSAPIKEGGPTIGGTPDSSLGSTPGGESIYDTPRYSHLQGSGFAGGVSLAPASIERPSGYGSIGPQRDDRDLGPQYNNLDPAASKYTSLDNASRDLGPQYNNLDPAASKYTSLDNASRDLGPQSKNLDPEPLYESADDASRDLGPQSKNLDPEPHYKFPSAFGSAPNSDAERHNLPGVGKIGQADPQIMQARARFEYHQAQSVNADHEFARLEREIGALSSSTEPRSRSAAKRLKAEVQEMRVQQERARERSAEHTELAKRNMARFKELRRQQKKASGKEPAHQEIDGRQKAALQLRREAKNARSQARRLRSEAEFHRDEVLHPLQGQMQEIDDTCDGLISQSDALVREEMKKHPEVAKARGAAQAYRLLNEQSAPSATGRSSSLVVCDPAAVKAAEDELTKIERTANQHLTESRTARLLLGNSFYGEASRDAQAHLWQVEQLNANLLANIAAVRTALGTTGHGFADFDSQFAGLLSGAK